MRSCVSAGVRCMQGTGEVQHGCRRGADKFEPLACRHWSRMRPRKSPTTRTFTWRASRASGLTRSASTVTLRPRALTSASLITRAGHIDYRGTSNTRCALWTTPGAARDRNAGARYRRRLVGHELSCSSRGVMNSRVHLEAGDRTHVPLPSAHTGPGRPHGSISPPSARHASRLCLARASCLCARTA